jgi:hypothetical protein
MLENASPEVNRKINITLELRLTFAKWRNRRAGLNSCRGVLRCADLSQQEWTTVVMLTVPDPALAGGDTAAAVPR